MKRNNMQNLHLKNLQHIEPIDIYLNKIEKIYHNKDKFKELVTLLNKLYIQIEKELISIKIINPNMQAYRDTLWTIYGIYKNKNFDIQQKNAYSIINYKLLTESFRNNIKKLKQLKNIDIDSNMINIEHIYSSFTPEFQIMEVIDINNHFTKSNRTLLFHINKNNIIIYLNQFHLDCMR